MLELITVQIGEFEIYVTEKRKEKHLFKKWFIKPFG